MFDYHLHSHISTDSDTPMIDLAAAAVAKGLKEICFTEHLDVDYPGFPPERGLADYKTYQDALQQTRNAFPDLSIKIGLEIGLEIDHLKDIPPRIEGLDFDFIIGSVHLLDGDDPYDPTFWDRHEQKEAYDRYARALIETIAECDFYDVAGHIGYIGKFNPHHDCVYRYSDYSDVVDEVLKSIIANGKGIEVNTSGLRTTPATLPEPNIIRRYFELGGEIITMGSDAHKEKDVGYGVNETLQTLKDIGFKYICAFEKRKPRFVPIP